MSDQPEAGEGTKGPAPKSKAAESREERLAASLRANLRRRKAQARGRKEDAKAETPGDPSGSGTS
jgi:hypothetical protein